MRQNLLDEVEKCRVKHGLFRSSPVDGNNGVFEIPFHSKNIKATLTCIVSDGGGWDHVSVEWDNHHQVPTWEMMCEVKRLFWDADEPVIQIIPAEENYINVHPYVLHLWKPQEVNIPLPPLEFV